MEKPNLYDALIIGGSYAGLSAAMTLGRSRRKVLIIDSGKPCNWQTPHSHNFITHDGDTPAEIARQAKAQVLAYPTVSFHNGVATAARKTEFGFEITAETGITFAAKKLLFATGAKDILLEIPGMAECWGVSVLHCPFCHGYEVGDQPLGLLGNGDYAFEFSRMLNNWSKNLTLFTNGKLAVTPEQEQKIRSHVIPVIETPIQEIVHRNGNLSQLKLADGSTHNLTAVFTRPAFTQHCELPLHLGCATNEQGYLVVDELNRTTVPGVFAAGDNCTPFRTVSFAVAAGTKAGAMLTKELIEGEF